MTCHGAGSSRETALYSLSSRNCTTSNCNGPTAANTGTAIVLPFRLRHWIAPSCSNCSSPCRNCLNLPVSLLCKYEKLSGVKRGIS